MKASGCLTKFLPVLRHDKLVNVLVSVVPRRCRPLSIKIIDQLALGLVGNHIGDRCLVRVEKDMGLGMGS